MYKFIYVFDKETADHMINFGLELIKSDSKKNIYVFENKQIDDEMKFLKSEFVFSNTLTF